MEYKYPRKMVTFKATLCGLNLTLHSTWLEHDHPLVREALAIREMQTDLEQRKRDLEAQFSFQTTNLK